MGEKACLTQETAEELYAEVRTIVDDDRMERKDRLVRLRQVLEDILQEAVRGDTTCPFADIFQRSVYVMRRDSVPARVQRRVHAMRETANQSAHDLFFAPTETQEHHAISADCELIAALSGVAVPVVLQAYCGMDDTMLEVQSCGARIDTVRAVVLNFSEPSQSTGKSGQPVWYRAVRCVLDEPDAGVETTLLLMNQWVHTPLWPFASIAATHCARSVDGRLSTTGSSLVTLQPDILIEATALAACFSPGAEHPNALLSLKELYGSRQVLWQAVAGRVAGAMFDALATGVQVDIPAFVDTQLRSQPLALLALSPDDLSLVRTNVTDHAGALRRAADRARNGGALKLEPFFASDRYGLQGRLDALVTEKKTGMLSVIELKNGAAPHLSSDDDVPDVRATHAAQTWCYELLVQSALGSEPGAADVVYLADEAHGWRPSQSRSADRIHLLQTRNAMVALDHQVAFDGDVSAFEQIAKGSFGPCGSFDGAEMKSMATALAGATELERAYFLAFSAFLGRERWATQLGTADDNGHAGGFASLWRMDLIEKEDRLAVLPYLQVTGRDAATGSVHLVQHPLRQDGSSFREGDGVVLYHHTDSDIRPLQGPLYKGIITALDYRLGEGTVALYNRYAVLEDGGFWAIEADSSDSVMRSQYASLLRFLQAPSDRKALLLGVKEPRAADPATLDLRPVRELTPHQRELLGKALAAQDYFLMQGPPGSGKTQVMMVEMVRHLMRRTDEAVLLLAYTNRAVGEMCHALDSDADPALHDYLVFGRDDVQEQPHGFAAYVREHGCDAGQALACRARVAVATVAMCAQHSEILQALRRRRTRVTAIVDEAAQLLEPQIVGILADVDRAIMIGDERQLPAVVQQSAQATGVTGDPLAGAGFHDLRISLFERLLQRCEKQRWNGAYGMLTDQARMHRDIVAFPDRAFYGGHLQPLYTWQFSEEPAFRADVRDPLESLLASHRVLFVPSAPQQAWSRVHEQEAHRTVRLVDAFASAYRRQDPGFDPASSIGVITPFRAQAGCIYRALPADLQGITVDTVERYQGGERDIIIVSLAVHAAVQVPSIMALSWDGSVDRKLNVMLTRARRHLVLLGDPQVLAGSCLPDGHPSHYALLLQELQEQNAWMEDPARLLGV